MAKEFGNEIIVNDSSQRNYRYLLVRPEGKKFDKEFKPELTPKEMLELGVFDGAYFPVDKLEFPIKWFEKARLAPRGLPDENLNYFGVHASQPLSVWQKRGWIHPDDPLGWFQWYCRYFFGRRLGDEDKRQISRWRAIKRHTTQLTKNCKPNDMLCRPRQRQALLHWAYDSRIL